MPSSLAETPLSMDWTSCSHETPSMELLASIHTKTEHALYELMLVETRNAMTRIGAFNVSHLMNYSGIHNRNSVRRARAGLVEKMSIECQRVVWAPEGQTVVYTVFSPEEILSRRQTAGLPPFAKGIFDTPIQKWDSKQPESLIEVGKLSRREAQVAMKCAEGISNAEIARTLFIQEETVKFHLRNIFVKLGVKRRTELMALLFQRERANGQV